MMREAIIRRDELLACSRLSPQAINNAVEIALARINRNITRFGKKFPAPSADHGTYTLIDNIEWTSGFWTGLLWLSYKLSGDAQYRAAAERHLPSYKKRIDERIATDTHDLGFLYSLSAIPAYQLTANTDARDTALAAADLLLSRYLPAAGIIQAWGDLKDPAQAGRMIIDCNLNLPLLYRASEISGNDTYRNAANTHIQQAMHHLVRPDASTFHTYFMDPVTGAPKEGRTHQGYSDTSCWARGQAWGICGFPMVYRHHRDPELIATAARLANYFLNRLPNDLVCCWDLVFVDQKTCRDSSAAAIAVCGLLELIEYLPADDADRDVYEAAAHAILANLVNSYACNAADMEDGLLRHAVYHMPNNVGVDESCIWGDYFYLEALARLTHTWETFW